MRASLEKELTESVLMLLHDESPKSFTRLFDEIKKERGKLSPKSLSSILKKLEKRGMIERRELRQIPPRVDYYITQKGEEDILKNLIQQLASISGLLPEQRIAREILMKACRKMLWADALRSEDEIDKYLSRFNLKLREFEEIKTVPMYEDLRLVGKMQRTSFKPIRGISLYKIREEYVPGRVSIHYGVMWPGIEINDFEGDKTIVEKVLRQLCDIGILKEIPEKLHEEKRYDLADADLKSALYELRNLSDSKWMILHDDISFLRKPTDDEIRFMSMIWGETEAFHIIKDAEEERFKLHQEYEKWKEYEKEYILGSRFPEDDGIINVIGWGPVTLFDENKNIIARVTRREYIEEKRRGFTGFKEKFGEAAAKKLVELCKEHFEKTPTHFLDDAKERIEEDKRKYAEMVQKTRERYQNVFKKYDYLTPIFKTINEDVFA